MVDRALQRLLHEELHTRFFIWVRAFHAYLQDQRKRLFALLDLLDAAYGARGRRQCRDRVELWYTSMRQAQWLLLRNVQHLVTILQPALASGQKRVAVRRFAENLGREREEEANDVWSAILKAQEEEAEANRLQAEVTCTVTHTQGTT